MLVAEFADFSGPISLGNRKSDIGMQLEMAECCKMGQKAIP